MEGFYEHIDDYMNGLLEGEALEQFENEMKQNESLKIAIENYDVAKGISEGLLEVDMMETLNRLKESDYEVVTGPSSHKGPIIQLDPKTDSKAKLKTQKFSITSWLVAASMIGIIAFTGWWVMEMNEDAKFKKYVLANYERPIDEDATKSNDTIGKSIFEKGKYYFALNDFEKSVPFFEKYLLEISDEELRSEAYEWLGATYLNIWRLRDAKEALGKSREEKAKRNLELLSQRKN